MGRGAYDVTYSVSGDLVKDPKRKKADEEGKKKAEASKVPVHRLPEVAKELRSCVNGEKADGVEGKVGVVERKQ